MAEANTPEPSIEDILASIRKIISDDEIEPEEPEQKAAEDAPAMTDAWPESNDAAAWPESNEEDEVLELTDVVEEPKPAPPPPPPVSNVTIMPQASVTNDNPRPSKPASDDSSILTERAMAAASGAFAKLSHYDDPPESRGSGKTVEDIARELLRPMLREWVDQYLPPIVEKLVERELRKISRKAEDL